MYAPWRISTTLRLFFVVILVIPIGLISAFILNMYERDLIEQNTTRSLQTVRAVAYSTQQEIARITGIFASIGMDSAVLETATSLSDASPADRQTQVNDLNAMIARYTSSVAGKVLSVTFFYKDGQAYSYQRNMRHDERNYRSELWYAESLGVQDRVHFIGMQETTLYGHYQPYLMAYTLSPSDFHTLHNVELIYFAFDGGVFDPVLQSSDGISTYDLITSEGKTVASNHRLAQGSPYDAKSFAQTRGGGTGSFVQEDADGGKKLIAYTGVDNIGWTVLQRLPFTAFMNNYENVFKSIALAAGIIGAAFLALSFYLVYNVTNPLRLLVRQMIRVRDGDLHARILASGSAEIVELGQSFNRMTGRIKMLLKQREEQERDKRKAEFAAMQSQINPHFLINTLGAIRMMAVIAKADHISGMTQALMRLLSSSFNRGSMLTQLGDEVENLKHYLSIMEVRFGNRFETIWRIDEQAADCYMLKMLLQPILENAIVHGVSRMEGRGQLHVSAKLLRSVELMIEVADNGPGITDLAMVETALQDGDKSFNGMGIANVHRRIQLHYGEEYGLQLDHNVPTGTLVRLRLPYLRSGDERTS